MAYSFLRGLLPSPESEAANRYAYCRNAEYMRITTKYALNVRNVKRYDADIYQTINHSHNYQLTLFRLIYVYAHGYGRI